MKTRLTHTLFFIPESLLSLALALSIHYISVILSHLYELIYNCPSLLSVTYREATDEAVRKPAMGTSKQFAFSLAVSKNDSFF